MSSTTKKYRSSWPTSSDIQWPFGTWWIHRFFGTQGSGPWSPSSCHPFFPLPPAQLHTTRPLNPWWWCQRGAPKKETGLVVGRKTRKNYYKGLTRIAEGKTIQNISLVQNVTLGTVFLCVSVLVFGHHAWANPFQPLPISSNPHLSRHIFESW